MAKYTYSRVTNDEEKSIIDMYNGGMEALSIANLFKKSQPTVYNVLRRNKIELRKPEEYDPSIIKCKDIKNVKELPTKEEILEKFLYLKDEGRLLNKKTLRRTSEGSNGYRECFFANSKNGCGRIRFLEHRLIYFIETGDQPKHIDHIDGDKANNCISNLRPSNKSQNSANKPKYLKNATSKYKGVYKPSGKKKWTAKIKVMKKNISLGSFDFEEDAARAYNEAAIKYFGDHAYLNNIEED